MGVSTICEKQKSRKWEGQVLTSSDMGVGDRVICDCDGNSRCADACPALATLQL